MKRRSPNNRAADIYGTSRDISPDPATTHPASTPDLYLFRHASTPLPYRPTPSPPPSFRRALINRIKSTADLDATHELDATADLNASDIEPPKTLRSNPLWRSITVVALFAAVAYTAGNTYTGNYSFGVPGGEYIPESLTAATSSLYSSIESLIKYPQRPGIIARQDGLVMHHPVVFVPGIISTSLEVWQAEPCAEQQFRQRLYGGTLMLKSLILDSQCWIKHMRLDNETGLDPPGIKLRAAAGLEAADYLMGGYWVWAKLIENFADIGYDSNNMFLAAYDWRLSTKDLQIRDYYFSRLQKLIEMAKASNHNRKVAVIAHSMGGNVLIYFYQWVTRYVAFDWVEQHIASNIHIGTPFLGVSKAYSSLFSGEMKDTAELAPFIDTMRQKFLMNQDDVIQLMRSFRSIPSMYPKGGDAVWGDLESAADDVQMHDDSLKTDAFKMIRHYSRGQCTVAFNSTANGRRGTFVTMHINGTRHDLTIESATAVLRNVAPEYMKAIDALYSFDDTLLSASSHEASQQRHWSNPLSHTLPLSKNMTTYCLHGVGRNTERSYSYAFDGERDVPYFINTSHVDEAVRLTRGVGYGDGDGTVNLISLGYMCQLWRHKQYNPSEATVVTREYKDKLSNNNTSALYNAIIDGVSTVIRSSDSVDHVDIMGNYDLILDLLRIIGKKKQPSSHDKYCSEGDKPTNASEIVNRNTTVVYDDATAHHKLIHFVSQHVADHMHTVNTTDDGDTDADVRDDHMHVLQRVASQTTSTAANNASDLSSAVEPGACLRKHISPRERNEERVDRHVERLRRFIGCDGRITHPDCVDSSDNNEAVKVGSESKESTRDTEHGDAVVEGDYTHYHYRLLDRYFSCIKPISEELNRRLGITVDD